MPLRIALPLMSSVGATLICKTVILLSIAFPADSTTGFAILFAETVLTVDEEIRVTPSSLATIFGLADVVLATTTYRGDAILKLTAATSDTFEVPVDVASIGVTATAVDVFTERPVAVASTLARATALDVLVEVPVVFELVVVTAEAVEVEIALPRTVVTPERCVCSAVAEDVASAVTLVVALATASAVELEVVCPVTLDVKLLETARAVELEVVCPVTLDVKLLETARAVELEVVCPVTSGVTLLETARAVLELKDWPRIAPASVSMINIFSASADVVDAQELLAVTSTTALVVPSGVSENANAPNAIRISYLKKIITFEVIILPQPTVHQQQT